jgi:pimeloyl-ACP methyl ester carboxylesterase
MLARLQQTISLTLLGAALVITAIGIGLGAPWLGPAFIAAIFISYAAVLAVEFALLLRSYPKQHPDRPSFRQAAAAWRREVTGTPRIFFWRQPFRSTCEPDHLPDGSAGRRGVILVHGFFCNRGLWNPWMRRLRQRGVPFIAVDLEPVLGSIDRYERAISSAVRTLDRSTGLAPVVVAHSMGGLAVRAWLAADRQARPHRVVTIASPHQGTRLGVPLQSTNMREMREGSPWLATLAGREPPALRERFVCFWSHCDNIVFPTRNATLPGADNRHLAGTPHVQMIFHPQVLAEVLDQLAAPD